MMEKVNYNTSQDSGQETPPKIKKKKKPVIINL